MADTAHAGNSTRIHWGGAASNTDIHLEVYKNQVDTAFQYNALFTNLSTQRTTVPFQLTAARRRLADVATLIIRLLEFQLTAARRRLEMVWCSLRFIISFQLTAARRRRGGKNREAV